MSFNSFICSSSNFNNYNFEHYNINDWYQFHTYWVCNTYTKNFTHTISFNSLDNLLVDFFLWQNPVISEVQKFKLHNIWSNSTTSVIKWLGWACTRFLMQGQGRDRGRDWDARYSYPGPNYSLVSPGNSYQLWLNCPHVSDNDGLPGHRHQLQESFRAHLVKQIWGHWTEKMLRTWGLTLLLRRRNPNGLTCHSLTWHFIPIQISSWLPSTCSMINRS